MKKKLIFPKEVDLYQRARALAGSWDFFSSVVSEENAVIISNGENDFTEKQKAFLEEIEKEITVEDL